MQLQPRSNVLRTIAEVQVVPLTQVLVDVPIALDVDRVEVTAGIRERQLFFHRHVDFGVEHAAGSLEGLPHAVKNNKPTTNLITLRIFVSMGSPGGVGFCKGSWGATR